MAGTDGLLTIPALAAEPGLLHGFMTTRPLDPAQAGTAGMVHGARVGRVEAAGVTVAGVDGLVSDRPGLPLLASFADCYPLIVYDPRIHAVGLAHAGWRGSAAGIAAELVQTLEREYGCRPGDLVAGIGPGICGDCYQVGPEVAQQFNGYARPDTDGRFRLDLLAANRAQLEAAGLPASSIHVHGACTFESPDLPSHRRRPDGTRFYCLVALK